MRSFDPHRPSVWMDQALVIRGNKWIVVLLLVCVLAVPACHEDDAEPEAANAGSSRILTPSSGTDDALSLGCRAEQTPYRIGKTTDGEMSVLWSEGGLRRFRVYLPASYRPGASMPLVLMLHGAVSDPPRLELKQSFMDRVADQEGFIVVYPEGTGGIRTWNAEACCGYAQRNQVDDVGFIRDLLDLLDRQLCVDSDRVYAAGMSNGGMLAYRLGCELSDRFAAVGAVAGTDGNPACSLSSPVSVMDIHGTEDRRVPYDGGPGDPGCGTQGYQFRSVEQTVDLWLERNRCGETASANDEDYPGDHGPDADCLRHIGCGDGVDVVQCALEGGGHQWPGDGDAIAYPNCPQDGPLIETFNASRELWRFFAAHPKKRSF